MAFRNQPGTTLLRMFIGPADASAAVHALAAATPAQVPFVVRQDASGLWLSRRLASSGDPAAGEAHAGGGPDDDVDLDAGVVHTLVRQDDAQGYVLALGPRTFTGFALTEVVESAQTSGELPGGPPNVPRASEDSNTALEVVLWGRALAAMQSPTAGAGAAATPGAAAGLGDDTCTALPGLRILPGATRLSVRAVAAGGRHALAVTAAGAVYAWGANESGQLGLGSKGGQRNAASQIAALLHTRVAAVTAGDQHSLAVTGTWVGGKPCCCLALCASVCVCVCVLRVGPCLPLDETKVCLFVYVGVWVCVCVCVRTRTL